MEQTLEVPYSQVYSNFYKEYETQLKQGCEQVEEPEISFDNLSAKQKKIVGLVRVHLEKDETLQEREPLQMIIQGQAGTGKSQVLKHIKFLLEKKCQQQPDFSYKVVSYTALAANQLGGETIHSAFSVPFAVSNADLRRKLEEPLKLTLSKNIKSIKLVLIDETSMVGKRLLYYLHKLFCKVHPERGSVPFGGKSIILAGDDSQLSPIDDFPLWTPVLKRTNPPILRKEMQEMSKIYRSIKCAFVLDIPFRQAGNNQVEFIQLLTRIRKGTCDANDYAAISSRMKCRLTENESRDFKDVVYAYPKRASVWSRNHSMLHSHFNADEIRVLNNGGTDLKLAIGCPVIIKKNLCSKAGVLNGSKAVVRDIIIPNAEEKQFGAQEMIIVEVEGYKGGVIVTSPRGRGLPILRIPDTEFFGVEDKCLVFPLDLGYSFTIHKIQGMEFQKLAICLDSNEMVPNLDYVAFSRVRNLQSLMIIDERVHTDRIIMARTRAKNWYLIQEMEQERLKEAEAQFELHMRI